MRTALILISAAVLIVGAFAIHPGIGVLVALLAYGAVDGLIRPRRKKQTPGERAEAHRRAMGYRP